MSAFHGESWGTPGSLIPSLTLGWWLGSWCSLLVQTCSPCAGPAAQGWGGGDSNRHWVPGMKSSFPRKIGRTRQQQVDVWDPGSGKSPGLMRSSFSYMVVVGVTGVTWGDRGHWSWENQGTAKPGRPHALGSQARPALGHPELAPPLAAASYPLLLPLGLILSNTPPNSPEEAPSLLSSHKGLACSSPAIVLDPHSTSLSFLGHLPDAWTWLHNHPGLQSLFPGSINFSATEQWTSVLTVPAPALALLSMQDGDRKLRSLMSNLKYSLFLLFQRSPLLCVLHLLVVLFRMPFNSFFPVSSIPFWLHLAVNLDARSWPFQPNVTPAPCFLVLLQLGKL